jgi:cytochrome c oxidase subunit 1
MVNDTIGRIAWFFVFVGFNLTFFPQFLLGVEGMPRRYATYLPKFQPMMELSSIGAWILSIGVFIMVVNLLMSLTNGEKAPQNPFNSLSLEWSVPSPPPHENFEKIPTVNDWTYGYGKKNKVEE